MGKTTVAREAVTSRPNNNRITVRTLPVKRMHHKYFTVFVFYKFHVLNSQVVRQG